MKDCTLVIMQIVALAPRWACITRNWSRKRQRQCLFLKVVQFVVESALKK